MNEQKKYPIEKVIYPVQRFMQQQKAGGIVLGVSVLIAFILANSAWSDAYFSFFDYKLGLQFNDVSYLTYSIHHWINDGLMAVFFFVVGLELKREIIAGELSNPRKALLPISAAIGGMLMPAAIYLLLNPTGAASTGWGIPMATDIAFALGVLYLFGDKIPLSLKVFLAALAIVDDLGAVLVIAFFYTSEISIFNLFIGLGFVATMYIGNRLGIRNVFFYMILGIVGVWTAFLLSGVHSTIAAVLAAFTIPADVALDENSYIRKIRTSIDQFKEIRPNGMPTLTDKQMALLEKIKEDTRLATPPLQLLEQAMHKFVIFLVIPIFAFANAGVSFKELNLETLFNNNIMIGVTAGLFLGKTIGVFFTSIILVKLRIASFPAGMNTRNLFGVSLLSSIGFTMSLFITSLAFTNPDYIMQSKIGIFVASLTGGFLGYFVLKKQKNATP
ncbi:Na+/H+ antiporter NhaA [Massilibacteroides vaginae]|uniref:Na+/H+ antiporter NhaA n=1 Tax=Massilibacteroides vaginae TaxID=1673718 RepID=UPI000BB3C300|nr:Na+/H+ antiporter NhaA [Massilibacteroides vaginae]